MRNVTIHYTSAKTGSGSDVWTTPASLYANLHAEFGFVYDAAADHDNHLCDLYSTIDGTYIAGNQLSDESGLENPWWSPTFCNPPYSYLRQFIQKAVEESKRGIVSVFLIPARTDTKAFQLIFASASEIRFLTGRLTFGGSTKTGKPTPAPFPSCIVVFRDHGGDSKSGPIVNLVSSRR